MKQLPDSIKRELTLEFRHPRSLGIAAAFSLVMTLSVSLAAGGVPLPSMTLALLLWLILFFCAMNGLMHIFSREIDEGTDLFLKSHQPAGVIFLSKLLVNLLIYLILTLVTLFSFFFFLNVRVNPVEAFPFFLAGWLSLGLITSVMSALVARARGRGGLISVISFPVMLPVLWILIQRTTDLFGGRPAMDRTLLFLLAFSFLVTMVTYLLFPLFWLDE